MSNVDTAKAAYEAFSSGDMAALRGFYADDAEWVIQDDIPLGGTTTGADAIVESFTTLGQYYSEFSLSPEEFVDGGDTVVVLGTQRATAANGSVECSFAHVIKYDSKGKLARGEFFTDTAQHLKALG